MKLIEGIGWLGAVAVIASCGLSFYGGMATGSGTYLALSGGGAIGIMIVSLAKQAWQPALLAGAWIALMATYLLRH